VDLPNRDSALYPGMYATVVLNVSSADHSARVPDDALIFRDGKTYAPVVRNDRIQLARSSSATTTAARWKSRAGSRLTTWSPFGVLGVRLHDLMKELWCFSGNRISVRFESEWHDESGQWYRTHGNEHWEFDDDGLMRRRDMSANDYPIEESERRYRWQLRMSRANHGG
jgi:nuclear transport factor 2 (NTF2) superfamily protein